MRGAKSWNRYPSEPETTFASVGVSRLCTQEQLLSTSFARWAEVLREPHMHLHRKLWEWCFITDALAQADMLRGGRTGLGFAVGREPLASFFASRGARILATDLAVEDAVEDGWVGSGEHAASLEVLNERQICPPDEFTELVSFRPLDMVHFDPTALAGYDFVWSSCAFEHLGSLDAGIEFVLRAMNCLRPGGIAIHTTEFNVGSNEQTLAVGQTVIYRKRDIEHLEQTLHAAGHALMFDWSMGTQPADYHVDVPPYTHDPHLKLHLAGYTTTSLGITIRRGS